MVNIEELVELVSKEIYLGSPNKDLIKSYLDLIREQSTIDPLVGVRNRTYGEKALLQAKQLSDQTGVPFSFFMFDVVDLKYYNNKYSRRIGDLAIQSAADFLLRHSRHKDDLFKYGESADEFGQILRNADREAADGYRKRIHQAMDLQKLKFRHKLRTYELPIRLHMVHSTYFPNSDLDNVILEANEMMNQTKTQK